MKDQSPYAIGAQMQTGLAPDQSALDANRYVFAYTFKLRHACLVAARLPSTLR